MSAFSIYNFVSSTSKNRAAWDDTSMILSIGMWRAAQYSKLISHLLGSALVLSCIM